MDPAEHAASIRVHDHTRGPIGSTSRFRETVVKKTLERILSEYGPIAVVIYFAIFFAVFFAAWGAIHLGWRPQSVAGGVGTFAAAYVVTKVTQPARIALTLVLTPIVAGIHRRLRPRRTRSGGDPDVPE